MPYRLAVDLDPENPNPHAWALDPELFATEAEASKAAKDRDTEEIAQYGDVYAGWLVVYDPIPRGGL